MRYSGSWAASGSGKESAASRWASARTTCKPGKGAGARNRLFHVCQSGAQPLESAGGRPYGLVGPPQGGTIVRAEVEDTHAVGLILGQRVAQGHEVTEVAMHLIANRRLHQRIVQPVAGERQFRGVRFRLSNLVLVVRKDEVLSTTVDIDLLSQVLQVHRRAFDVPAGATGTPGARPSWFTGPGRLPQDKVHGMFLPRIGLNAGTRLHLVQGASGEPEVPGERGHAVVNVSVNPVGMPSGHQPLNDLNDLGNHLGGARIVGGATDTQRVCFAEKASDILLGNLDGIAVFADGAFDDPVLDIGEVLDVRHGVTTIFQVAPHDVEKRVAESVPDVGRSVEVGTTHIHPHPAGFARGELFDALGERVVQAQGHAKTSSPSVAKKRSTESTGSSESTESQAIMQSDAVRPSRPGRHGRPGRRSWLSRPWNLHGVYLGADLPADGDAHRARVDAAKAPEINASAVGHGPIECLPGLIAGFDDFDDAVEMLMPPEPGDPGMDRPRPVHFNGDGIRHHGALHE